MTTMACHRNTFREAINHCYSRRVGVKYFSEYLSQVQVLFHICKYKYKFKYSEYMEDIKYIKYFFNQVQVKYKYFCNKQ